MLVLMVCSVLKEAMVKEFSFASIWLDTGNVYESMTHKLIFFALRQWGIPSQWIQIVESYYVVICSKFLSESATS